MIPDGAAFGHRTDQSDQSDQSDFQEPPSSDVSGFSLSNILPTANPEDSDTSELILLGGYATDTFPKENSWNGRSNGHTIADNCGPST